MRLVLLAALLALTGCKPQSYEELDAKVRAQDADQKARARQAEAGRRAVEAEANRVGLDQQRAEQAKADEDKKTKEEGMETLRSVYSPMTPAQREKALRTLCGRDEGCELQMRRAIAGAAATEAERAKLESISASLVAENFTQRDFYVGEVARYFISKGEHGFSVDADGPGKKRFVINAAFCSDAFIQRFVLGDWGSKARDRGFDRIECGAWARNL